MVRIRREKEKVANDISQSGSQPTTNGTQKTGKFQEIFFKWQLTWREIVLHSLDFRFFFFAMVMYYLFKNKLIKEKSNCTLLVTFGDSCNMGNSDGKYTKKNHLSYSLHRD